MHMVINKIHPKKLTIHTPHWDFDTLAKTCVAMEKKLFLQEDNHLPTGKTKGERQAKDIEALTGNESLHTWIHREAFAQMRQAASWEELHKVLALNGLTMSLRGAGVMVTSDSGHRITGSNIARELSKPNLEKRFGAFEPRPAWCKEIKAERQYSRAPIAPASPLREEYEKLRDSGAENKVHRLDAIEAEFTKKKKALLAENALDRARARNTHMGRFAKRKLFDAIHRKHVAQMEKLKAEMKKARSEVYRESTVEGWAQWLQEQAMKGRIDAIEALRKRVFAKAKSGSASLSGETPANTPSLIPDQRIDGVTKHGTVIYDLGRDAIRDDGESFRLGVGAAPGTDILALQLAKERFGAVIFADGDRAFRAKMIKAAVEGKVFIKFGDPDMERQRNEMFKFQYQERKQAQTRSDGGDHHRPPARLSPEAGGCGHLPSSSGLTIAEMWGASSNSVRESVPGDGYAKIGRTSDGREHRPPGLGLTMAEMWNARPNPVREPGHDDGHARSERPEHGRDRDDDTTRGASLSR